MGVKTTAWDLHVSLDLVDSYVRLTSGCDGTSSWPFSFPQQVHRRVLPSHTVYAANLERLLSRMWHPGHDEIEQNQLHNHEAKRRYERLKQQRSLRMWPLCVAIVRKTGAKRRYERLRQERSLRMWPLCVATVRKTGTKRIRCWCAVKTRTESKNVTFVCSHCS